MEDNNQDVQLFESEYEHFRDRRFHFHIDDNGLAFITWRWGINSDDDEELEQLFPRLTDFEFPPISNYAIASGPILDFFSIDPFPRVSFLSMVGYRMEMSVEVLLEERQRLYHRLLALYGYESKSGHGPSFVKEELLPALVARRDALKGQLCYNAERLRVGPFDVIRSLLMVWTAVARKERLRRLESGEIDENDIGQSRYYIDLTAHEVWRQIISGVAKQSLTRVNGWLSWLPRRGPRKLSQIQINNILRLLLYRDIIIKESIPLEIQLLICERLLLSSTKNAPIPSLEELIQQEEARRIHEEKQRRKEEARLRLKRLTNRQGLWEYVNELRQDGKTVNQAYDIIDQEWQAAGIEPIYATLESFRAVYYKSR